MRDGLDHRWAGKHADSNADAHADANTVVYPITIQRAHAIEDRATRADTNPTRRASC